MNGICRNCDKHGWLMPLHGEKGGPLFCFMCAGAWNAKHTRRRKWGRIIIKAMKMYQKEGGKWSDLDKFKLLGTPWDLLILPGYEDTIGTEVGDITTELLADTLQLTHPDRHPPERQQLAKRVTQELLALQPFVFPAPKPKPVPDMPPPRDTSLAGFRKPRERAVTAYPCELCHDQAPCDYCDPCRAEWERRQENEREVARKRQREWYRCRQQVRRHRRAPVSCAVCGTKVRAKRQDAKYCSAACRQRSYRLAVTDKNDFSGASLISRHPEVTS